MNYHTPQLSPLGQRLTEAMHRRSDAFSTKTNAASAARVAPEPQAENARRFWAGKHIAAAESWLAENGEVIE